MRTLPSTTATACPELNKVWSVYSQSLIGRPGVMIPDTDEDLNWHAFLGHTIDMQGFRAAEFSGVDALTRRADFRSLMSRGIGVRQLGELWEVAAIRQHLLSGARGTPMETTYRTLESDGGSIGRSLAEAFQSFPWRKGHWTVRALLQNSAALKEHGYSFRRWLRQECEMLAAPEFAPRDFRKVVRLGGREVSLERALRTRLEQTFYQVGPATAAYTLCDWQLWLWNEGRCGVFENFKLDSFQQQFVSKYGRGVVPEAEADFTKWWLSQYPDVPPRLANECIWLGVENRIV